MQTPAAPSLPQFISPRFPFPIIILSDQRLLRLSEFDTAEKGKGTTLVEFGISLVNWNITPGSQQSLALLKALEACENKQVLVTPYVSLLVEQKWAYCYSFTLLLTCLYTAMLVALVLLLKEKEVVLGLIFVMLNILLMLYELGQMLIDGWTYWFDPWNWVDCIRGVACIVWAVLHLEGWELAESEESFLRLLVALLCFLRGFTYFKSFRMTRLFVFMTISVVKDIYSFLIILAYSVFAYGICFSALQPNFSVSSSWVSAFILLLGSFESNEFTGWQWGVFTGAAIINVIIMMNLLISILGDAYEKAQLTLQENNLS
jgi:hypothetical protein